MLNKQDLAFLKQILSLNAEELLEWCSQNGPDRVEHLNQLMDRYAEHMKQQESTLDAVMNTLKGKSSVELTLAQAFELDLIEYPSELIH